MQEGYQVGWTERDRFPVVTLAAVVLAVAAVALLVLGVPTVDVHPPTHYLGIMDPGCGGTRAMFFLLTGNPATGARYNPVVFPFAAATLLVLLRGVIGTTTGRWWEARLGRAARRALLMALAVAVIALGVRQQMHAELLMADWPPTP